MGLFEVLKNIAQPEEDDDSDFFEGADVSLKPQPKPQEERPSFVSAAQAAFENSFGDSGRAAEIQPQSTQNAAGVPASSATSAARRRRAHPRLRAADRALSTSAGRTPPSCCSLRKALTTRSSLWAT